MGNQTAADVMYVTSDRTRVAAAELRAYERAVTPVSSTGQVCPITGDTGPRAFTPAGIDLAAGYRSARFGTVDSVSGIVGVMGNDQLKPRTGYHATSGTG